MCGLCLFFFFFSSRRRHTRFDCDWSSDVCSSDLVLLGLGLGVLLTAVAVEHRIAWMAWVIVAIGLVWLVCLLDRKSTRLNSSHSQISYAVFCLKKKTKSQTESTPNTATSQTSARP